MRTDTLTHEQIDAAVRELMGKVPRDMDFREWDRAIARHFYVMGMRAGADIALDPVYSDRPLAYIERAIKVIEQEPTC